MKGVSLKKYFERVLSERDARYMQMFKSAEEAVSKADAALKEYKLLANEFRGTLKDQAVTLMPRAESENRFSQHDEKIRALELSERAGEGSTKAKEGSRAQSWQVVVLTVTIALFLLGILVTYLTTRHPNDEPERKPTVYLRQ